MSTKRRIGGRRVDWCIAVPFLLSVVFLLGPGLISEPAQLNISTTSSSSSSSSSSSHVEVDDVDGVVRDPSTSVAEEGRPAVAVCFFGLTRSLRRHTFPSIKRFLLQPLHRQNFSVDVFLHTYAVDVLFNPWGGEFDVKLDRDEWRLLRPVAYEIEDLAEVDAAIDYAAYLKYGNPWEKFNPSNITVYNHVRQLRSVHRCWDLVERHMKGTGKAYRYVIMARPDVRYLAPGLPDLESFCLAPDCYARHDEGEGDDDDDGAGEEEVVQPRGRIGIAYEDRFAVGAPEAIKAWATRDDYALDYVNEYHIGLKSETFSRWAALLHDLQVVIVPFCFERIRADGRVAFEEDAEACFRPLHPNNEPPSVVRQVPGSEETYLAVEEGVDDSYLSFPSRRWPPPPPRYGWGKAMGTWGRLQGMLTSRFGRRMSR